jgi:hypothetical protein
MVLDLRAVAVRNTDALQSGQLRNISEETTNAIYLITRCQSGGRTFLRNVGKCHISEGIALFKSDAPCIANSTGAAAHFAAILSSPVRHAEESY